jgi:hypothetical protein
LALLAAAIVLSCSVGLVGAPQDARHQALEEFQWRISDYFAVRFAATCDLPPIPATGSIAATYAVRQRHVRAVREAREDADRGDVFGPKIAPIIRATIADTLRERGIAVEDLLAELRADAPRGGRRPDVNDEFPWVRGAAMPYSLIVALPRLPATLEYRFLDRDLILLDVDLGIVVDILPDALPKK